MNTSFQNFFKKLIGHGLEYFGLFYGSYRATVIDNNDPEALGRLKISCLSIYGEDIHDYWAWPKVSFAGSDIGFFAIPQIGDGVYIEFECGDTKYPIWSGGWWAKPGAISEVPATARLLPPTNRVLQTSAGHMIELDDTPGAEKIKITDQSGNSILIDSITKNEEHVVQGDRIDNITVNQTETIGANKTSNVIGNKDETIIGQKTSNVALGKTEQIGLQWNITVIGNANIIAPTITLTGLVKLASQIPMLKLITSAFVALFNSHSHSGCGGTSNSGPPNQQMSAAHQTLNTEAS